MQKTFVYSSDLGNLNMFLTIILKTINTIYCKDTFCPQHHNDTIIKKEKELLRALLIQFCKLEFIWKILLSIHQEISFVHPYETNALHFS